MPSQHVIEVRAEAAELHDQIIQEYIWEAERLAREPDYGGWSFGNLYSNLGVLLAEKWKRARAAEEEDDDESEEEHWTVDDDDE